MKDVLQKIAKVGSRDDLEAILNNIGPETDRRAIIASLLNSKNSLKYSVLHTALFSRFFLCGFNFFSNFRFSRNIEVFNSLIDYGSDIDAKCNGTPVLHLAITTMTLPNGDRFGFSCLEKLINNGVDISCKV